MDLQWQEGLQLFTIREVAALRHAGEAYDEAVVRFELSNYPLQYRMHRRVLSINGSNVFLEVTIRLPIPKTASPALGQWFLDSISSYRSNAHGS
jgi:hypothetical protein